MSVKHALLGMLAKEPKHGYDLKRAFDETLGDFWTLNYGQIYTTLERMLTEGLVEPDPTIQADKPDRKVYRITATGRDEFSDWQVRTLKAEPRALRDELFIRILFLDDDNADSLIASVRSQQSTYLAQMMQLTDRKFQIEQESRRALQKAASDEQRHEIERGKLIKIVLIDVALLHAEADVRWLQQCETRIREFITKPDHS